MSVKPNTSIEALENIRPFLSSHQLIISIVAGLSLERIQRTIVSKQSIIRAMPNTSVTIGLATTFISYPDNISDEHRIITETLFDAVGITTVVSEELQHAATGVFGSGPAYVYFLMEAMVTAATEQGFPSEITNKLVVETVYGAAKMARDALHSPKELRRKVTSPNGTTQAGIEYLEQFSVKKAIIGAITKSSERSLKDCTVYKDKDGTGYFIYDRVVDQDRCLHIVKLSEDYLSFTNVYRRLGVAYWREAAAILYHNRYYFMFTSGLTGWNPNPAKYFRAESLLGPWIDMGDPCENDITNTTFQSQSTYILPVEEKPGLFIFMAERHNTQNFEHCSYIWLPVEFPTQDTAKLTYRNSWRLEDF
ncbi:pyrroline-5-carboxylate reductase dimerization domain-containing protein [Paenibacillus donghaensis]|uniref:Pyrroline-5-carboxylate reductase n=1 Tax=Paenibacillus donghaensis TaxID=414771 RepID=A0A2Z2KCU1_9BACL|nr:pyrroline-5-carboxylate reductase dimerization domain-containing protein [Paenibacillus donghaensis]ASA19789.1 hypothetical protein B9T62_02575 [Paenibacillus donghaensis]